VKDYCQISNKTKKSPNHLMLMSWRLNCHY
jgi:hypothetical protein